MKNNKIIAVVAVAALVVAAFGVILLTDSGESEKKGLYMLNATTIEVDMGKCSATPAVIVTIEDMYEKYYGELVDDALTLDDAKADTEFWNTFCDWTSMLTDNMDGTYDVYIKTTANGDETVTIPVSSKVIVMGTMYTETMYFLACAKYNVEPYSSESFNNADLKNYMNTTIAGGMLYSYYTDNDVEYMVKTVNESTYDDLGVNSVQKLDPERLGSAIKASTNEGADGDVIYFASGTRISTSEHYNSNTQPVINAKTTEDYNYAHYAFFAPTDLNEVFPCIECIGLLLGFDEDVINEVIEDIQLRLYKVYYSVQEKTENKPVEKAYWEGSSGKAIKSAMGSVILEFLGFDTSLLDGGEHDLESLLVENPRYIIFYTNDGRSETERMRADN